MTPILDLATFRTGYRRGVLRELVSLGGSNV